MPYYCLNCAYRSDTKIVKCQSCHSSFAEVAPKISRPTFTSHSEPEPIDLDFSEVVESLASLVDNQTPASFRVESLETPKKGWRKK